MLKHLVLQELKSKRIIYQIIIILFITTLIDIFDLVRFILNVDVDKFIKLDLTPSVKYFRYLILFFGFHLSGSLLRDLKYNTQSLVYSTPILKRDYFLSKIVMSFIYFLLIIICNMLVNGILYSVYSLFTENLSITVDLNNLFFIVFPFYLICSLIFLSFSILFKTESTDKYLVFLIIIVDILVSVIINKLNLQYYKTYFNILPSGFEKYLNEPNGIFKYLINRIGLVLIFSSLAIYAIKKFNFKLEVLKVKEKKIRSKSSEIISSYQTKKFDYKSELLTIKELVFQNLKFILKSKGLIVVFLVYCLITVWSILEMEMYFDIKPHLLTYNILEYKNMYSLIFKFILSFIIIIPIIKLEKNKRINEIINTTPISPRIQVISKFISGLLVFIIYDLLLYLFCIGFQITNNSSFEISQYSVDFFITNIPSYSLLISLVILSTLLFRNFILASFFTIICFNIQELYEKIISYLPEFLNPITDFILINPFFKVGYRPNLFYTDLNGYGGNFEEYLWYTFLWVLVSLMFLKLSTKLYLNYSDYSLLKKLKITFRTFIKKDYTLNSIILVIFFLLSVSVYNTNNVTPEKLTDLENELMLNEMVNYEKTYKGIVQPKVVSSKYFVDLYPHKGDIHSKIEITIQNKSNEPIDSILINHFEQTILKFPKSKLIKRDTLLDYSIYKLNKSLKPKEKLTFTSILNLESEGFIYQTHRHLHANGAFIKNVELKPIVGYVKRKEITSIKQREKYGLEKLKDEILSDICTDVKHQNYISNGESDFIKIETIISTSKDQTAVAPGSLVKKWEDKGRNYFHYKVDDKTLDFISFVSAKYEIKKKKWNDVNIEVYYHKDHYWNIDNFINVTERSLEYYTKNFGSYHNKQLRIIEFPRYETFAQSFAGTIPYSESFGFTSDLEDKEANNIIDAVGAHEIAHQWWGHQMVGCPIEGATLIGESLPEVSSLLVMKDMYKNQSKIKQFIKHNHTKYNSSSTNETIESPLYKVKDHELVIRYQKGGIALYAIQDYIGEEKFNKALQSFLGEFKFQDEEYPTSLDFIEHLEPQVPDSLNYLIDDLLKSVTFYNNKIIDATHKKLDNGKFQITLKTEFEKYKINDSIKSLVKNSKKTSGVKLFLDLTLKELKTKQDKFKVPKKLNDYIEIGFYNDEEKKSLFYSKKVKIYKKNMELNFELDSLPKVIEIDPKMLLFDKDYEDNDISL